MKFIQGLATVAVTGLAVVLAESARELHTFRVRRYELSFPELSGKRLLFVTDYHEAVGGKLNAGLLDTSRRLHPDLILIGGDMVNGKRPNENVMPAVELVNGLADIAPVVYAHGNHERRMVHMTGIEGYDWHAYEDQLDPRVKFLINEQTLVNLGGTELRIYGLDAGHPYYTRGGKVLPVEEIDRLLGKRDTSRPSILLAHDPSWFDAYMEWGAHLTLSGHYHGGVARLPWVGGLINPKFQLFPKYDYGLYERDGCTMMVSSGLGQHTLPLRWCNLPELVVIDCK